MGVEYVAIDDGNLDAAVAMLARGFPARPQQHWRNGLERMRSTGQNARLGVPLGRLLRVNGTDVGVLLTPAGEQVDPDGAIRHVVNLSSWYLEPEQRWRAPIMLKGAMADPAVTYTDLTPTRPVQAIIKALGFRVVNDGVVVVATPIAALAPSACHIVDLDDVPAEAVPQRLRANLEAHRQLGCLALAAVLEPVPFGSKRSEREGPAQAIESGAFPFRSDDSIRSGNALGGRYIPLLVRPIRLKKVPGAQVLYCGDGTVLRDAVPALSRRLLRGGRLALLFDLTSDCPGAPGGVRFPGRSFRFVKGQAPAGVTDLTWSEFAYFDVYS